jgi:hypothetical protein
MQECPRCKRSTSVTHSRRMMPAVHALDRGARLSPTAVYTSGAEAMTHYQGGERQ